MSRFSNLSFSGKTQLVIFAIALVVRLVLVSQFATKPLNDLLWGDQVGWNLAQGNGFTASQSEPRVPGIFRTPAYPFFLAAIYWIFGHTYTPVYIAQCILDAASAILLGRIILLHSSSWLAAVTSFLYAVYPYPGMFCGVVHQDILLIFATLATLYAVSRAIRSDRSSLWLWVGFALGISALVKANMMLLIVPAIFFLLFYSARRRVIRLAFLLLAFGITLFPWVLRNYLVFGGFPPLAAGATGNNLRLLVLELNEGEEALRQVGLGDPRTQPGAFFDGRMLIDHEKEEAKRHSRELLRRWPEYSVLILKHIPRLWVTRFSRWHGDTVALVATGLSIIVLVCGIAGMVLTRKSWRTLLPLYTWVIFITLMYAPYTPEARYTLPARPVMLFFVAVLITVVLRRIGWLTRDRSLFDQAAGDRIVEARAR